MMKSNLIKYKELRTWLKSQQMVKVCKVEQMLDCVPGYIAAKLKQMSGTSYTENSLVSAEIMLKHIHTIFHNVGKLKSKSPTKSLNILRSESQVKSKIKETSKKQINYLNPEKIDGGMLKDTSGRSVKIIPSGHPKQ